DDFASEDIVKALERKVCLRENSRDTFQVLVAFWPDRAGMPSLSNSLDERTPMPMSMSGGSGSCGGGDDESGMDEDAGEDEEVDEDEERDDFASEAIVKALKRKVRLRFSTVLATERKVFRLRLQLKLSLYITNCRVYWLLLLAVLRLAIYSPRSICLRSTIILIMLNELHSLLKKCGMECLRQIVGFSRKGLFFQQLIGLFEERALFPRTN
ncbi:hypothetical protein Tco_0733792, partial [Tanacetum coccineum]